MRSPTWHRHAIGHALALGFAVGGVLTPRPAAAQEPFLGEIRWVAFNFAPTGWALCDGQILSITQNTALFALLGTTYGGNGQTTFALPDMRGRVPVHPGAGPGLTARVAGEAGGEESVTLTTAAMPSHSHSVESHTHTIPPLGVDVKGSSAAATSASPAGNVLATATLESGGGAQKKLTEIYNAGAANVSLAPGSATTAPGVTGGGSGSTTATGGDGPHENMQPFLGVTCIIALQGIFPSRS